jgi:type I restriction enzyme, R subunit
VVEAKAYHEGLTEGLGQAKNYAEKLDIRYTYSTNGQGFYGVDMEVGTENELGLEEFPSPQALWQMTYSTDNYLA